MLVTKDQLLSHREYAALRSKFVQEVITEKKRRRVAISDKMSGLFENRLTVWFQIQEMIHAEQMEKDEYIEEMLEVYNELMPADNELSMTLFVEIPDQQQLRAFNKTIVGIENYVHLQFRGHKVTGVEPEDETDGGAKDYTQSVHYLHFPFSAAQKAAFAAAEPHDIKLVIDHPNYSCEKALLAETVQELQKQWIA